MANNGGKFKKKCDCGMVKIGNEWYGSMLFTEEMLKNLPKESCPWCLMAKTPQKHCLLLVLD